MLAPPFALRLTILAAAVISTWGAPAKAADKESTPAPAATPKDALKEAQKEAEAAPLGEEPAPPAKLQRVEIKASADGYNPRRDDTASKIIVNSEEIQRYGDTSVTDVLKRLPGITVSGAAGRGGEIRMRGLGSGYTQILLNGERMPAGFSLESLAPDVIERIEVLRAASAEFSTQSIAGTINIVLKKAIKNAQREWKASIAKGAGSVSPSASLQTSDRNGDFSYSLGATLNRYEAERDSSWHQLDVDAGGRPSMSAATLLHDKSISNNANLAPRLNWTLDGGDTLTSQSYLSLNNYDSRNGSVLTPILGSSGDFARVDSHYSSHGAYARSELSWVHKLAAGGKLDTKLSANLNRGSSDGAVRSQDVSTLSQQMKLALDRNVHAYNTDKGLSSTGKYSAPWITDHALALGWDGGMARRDETRQQREADLRADWAAEAQATPPGQAAPNGARAPLSEDQQYRADVRRLALYGQDEWNVTPNWSLYLGLRWEGLSTSAEGRNFDPVTRRSSVWSPLMQTLYKLPGGKDQLRLALTRTYKAPSTNSLVPRRFISTNNSQIDPDRRGNPNLKPELALGLDASYEHYWGESALLSASASMRRIDDYTRPGLLYENERWVATSINDGRAVTRGVELEAKFPLSTFIDKAPAIDLRASVSRNWSRVEAVPGPDNRLDQQTPLSATVGVDYKSAGGALAAGASLAFRNGGQVRAAADQYEYVSVRRDLDLYALWKFDAKNQLRLAVGNALGQDYLSNSTFVNPDGGTRRRNSVYPGGVQLRLTLELKL
ncbi:TonB-dependent receptor plug domain-containing protein [Rugamonas sp. CCM 8940]|uniref:TonB-dependent receptor plug domain-containing protein n=1 Tax=Rugamonas sp. CCM 8940 TaxID=2765359 RepID=UPI0018F4F467|nr:TonB-dependent receptor [Rugamonas sp. CCM 8940]MBJ7311661.1 TonB-dependent receptor [Rugamonas sp. CCM 8940]